MKTKKVTVRRSRLGKALIWLQMIIVSPILTIAVFMSLMGEFVISTWSKYRNWFIRQF